MRLSYMISRSQGLSRVKGGEQQQEISTRTAHQEDIFNKKFKSNRKV